MLLLSNSTPPGRGFLEHALGVIDEVLRERRRVLYIALASGEPARYAQIMRDSLAPIGVSVASAETIVGLGEKIADAEALFVGGGNSFRLLQRLRSADVLDQIRARVAAGVPYFGASAGANIACPTIGTTNDMPIVEPGSFRALELIPIQLNAHYPETGPVDTGTGDTRDRQIAGFLEENNVPVLAMPEGTWLRVIGAPGRPGAADAACAAGAAGASATTGGVTGCRLFCRGEPPRQIPAGSDVTAVLGLPG